MDEEEIKVLLRRNLEIAKENNRMLKKIRRAELYGLIFKILWILVIIGVPVALYYYVILPYLGELSSSLDALQKGASNVDDIFRNIPFIGEFLGGESTSTPSAE